MGDKSKIVMNMSNPIHGRQPDIMGDKLKQKHYYSSLMPCRQPDIMGDKVIKIFKIDSCNYVDSPI